MLHLWRKSVACWIILVKTLLCLIFSLLLFWVCMPYKIFSVPLLVLCTRLILHVLPIILYLLAYCDLLFLSLVGITVCGCNQILQICGCRLIIGEEFLVVWDNLYWFLPVVAICPTIEGGSIYLHFIFPIWSGSWVSELISLNCFFVINW